MIDKELLTQTVADAIAGTDLFVVDITVSPSNEIVVELDSATGVDIDTCATLTRRIEEVFDRDVEDYQLEVGSAGITSDFRIRAQYDKNLGNDVEVLTRDGRKLRGVLTAVADGDGADRDVDFTVEVPVKVKEPGAKRPVVKQEAMQFNSKDCKYVRYDLKF
ncbi:MAG: ribosome assembly cofactor RimP [Muribaculaceae bacterium]|nr:ribosome assembly cofactor RimP [Muribaculaceae bacterium]